MLVLVSPFNVIASSVTVTPACPGVALPLLAGRGAARWPFNARWAGAGAGELADAKVGGRPDRACNSPMKALTCG